MDYLTMPELKTSNSKKNIDNLVEEDDDSGREKSVSIPKKSQAIKIILHKKIKRRISVLHQIDENYEYYHI